MKELTIEQKAKAYNEALEKAKKYHHRLLNEDNQEWASEIEELFPELRESEDEKIRKALIEYFNEQCDMSDWNGIYGYQVVAWLEKQEGCEVIRKEWLEHIKQSWYREGFIDGKYSDVKGCTINDDVILKELIDFLENRTAKLQHDLTRYANWLKIKFTPKKHLE